MIRSARIRVAGLAALFLLLCLGVPFWLARENRFAHPTRPIDGPGRRNAKVELQTHDDRTKNSAEHSLLEPEPATPDDNRRRQHNDIPKRFVVSTHDGRALDAVLAWALANGVAVDAAAPELNAVALTLPDNALLRALRAAVPGITVESNVWIYAPDLPGRDSTGIGTVGAAFRNNALQWLGVDANDNGRGHGVRIAILDTAVQTHPALESADVTRLAVGDVPFPDVDGDYRGHGTAIASLLAGSLDGQVEGIAPDAELIAIEVLDANGVGNAFDLARGILMALDQGATVINMSLGTYSDSAVVRQAVELALSQGVMVVAAAGNEGVQGLTYPAAYPGVIAVSAVDARGEHAEYANTDPNVDIAAPGVGIYAAWEDDALVSFSGTSAAAPFVAGTLAMLLGGDAAVGTDEALDLIRDYANDNGAPGPDAEYGAGTLNVGRILQRDQPGIIDAAISSHYIDAQTQTDTVIPLLVSAQNRGTENIPNLEVVVSSNGKTTVHTFTNVLVGETVSVELPISTTELQDQQAIDLETFIRIPGLSVDAVPENDARSSRIHLTGDSSTQQ
jgi:hypothetical protein